MNPKQQQKIVAWCGDLETHLKCSECQVTLVKRIYQCEKGHLVCSSCNARPPQCCPTIHTRVRNYFAENFAGKMEEKRQMEALKQKENLRFFCWFQQCNFRGSIDEIRKHYQEKHSGQYEKHHDDKLPHSASFCLDYFYPQTTCRLLDIPGTGLFLLQISIYRNGALRAHLFMYESERNAMKYQYKLKIECNKQNSSVEGILDTVRIYKHLLGKKGLFVPVAHNLQMEIQSSLEFTCVVEMDRNPAFTEAKSPAAKKSRQRNSNGNVLADVGEIKKGEKPTNRQKLMVSTSMQMAAAVPQVFNPMFPGGQPMGYQAQQIPNGGFNHPAAGLPQGYQQNQHVGAPPGAFPGSNPYYRPSAPVDDGTAARAMYPDLTGMQHRPTENRFPGRNLPSVYGRQNHSKQRGSTKKCSHESKNDCTIW